MKHHAVVASFVVMLCMHPAMGSGQDGTATPPPLHLSRHDLRQLVKTADTAAQFHALSDYYRNLQTKYERETDQERQEWIRRQKSYSNIALKYPSPVDSARALYDYYRDMARAMETKAVLYREKASRLADQK